MFINFSYSTTFIRNQRVNLRYQLINGIVDELLDALNGQLGKRCGADASNNIFPDLATYPMSEH
jgi:hypothetical protein